MGRPTAPARERGAWGGRVVSISIVVLPGRADEVAVTVASFLVVAPADAELRVGGTLPAGMSDRRIVAFGPQPIEELLRHSLTSSSGGWVAMLRAGDEFEPGALAAVEAYLSEIDADVVYTDHRYVGSRDGVALKPRWLPRLLEQTNYLGRLVAVRRGLAEQAIGEPWNGEWDYLLRVTERARHVGHVPVVAVSLSAPELESSHQHPIAIVEGHLRRTTGESVVSRRPDGSARVRAHVPPDHMVSIIVPTRGGRRRIGEAEVLLAENMILSLIALTTHPTWEVILVASEGTDPLVLDRLMALDGRVSAIKVEGTFNFSASVNAGARAARGPSLLLLNDDVEVLEPAWLSEMLGVLLRTGTGAVGAKLLYPDRTIQHIGVVCPPYGLPLHPRIFERDSGTWDTTLDVDYLAVTGACLLTHRSDFFEVGGFTENLPLNFNDVDYCLKLALRGRATVCVNAATLLHFESSTRTAQILDYERDAYRAWEAVTLTDPHTAYWV